MMGRVKEMYDQTELELQANKVIIDEEFQRFNKVYDTGFAHGQAKADKLLFAAAIGLALTNLFTLGIFL